MAESNANPIASWIERQVAKGFKGFELLAREGQALSLVDRYPASHGVADTIYGDAVENAAGVTDHASAFVVRALSEGAGPFPTRAFTVQQALPLHEPERYGDANTLRLLLEHIDKQNKVIVQVVPACLASMGGMVNGLSQHFGTLAETHESAIRALRESRTASLEAERAMMLDVARQQRFDKLLDTGIGMLPAVIEKLGKPS